MEWEKTKRFFYTFAKGETKVRKNHGILRCSVGWAKETIENSIVFVAMSPPSHHMGWVSVGVRGICGGRTLTEASEHNVNRSALDTRIPGWQWINGIVLLEKGCGCSFLHGLCLERAGRENGVKGYTTLWPEGSNGDKHGRRQREPKKIQ